MTGMTGYSVSYSHPSSETSSSAKLSHTHWVTLKSNENHSYHGEILEDTANCIIRMLLYCAGVSGNPVLFSAFNEDRGKWRALVNMVMKFHVP
jgi:hypothetical protein